MGSSSKGGEAGNGSEEDDKGPAALLDSYRQPEELNTRSAVPYTAAVSTTHGRAI